MEKKKHTIIKELIAKQEMKEWKLSPATAS